jgi:GNAT superfamily N-acetyltransferase
MVNELRARVGDEADLRVDGVRFPEILEAFVPPGFCHRFGYPSYLKVVEDGHLEMELRLEFWPEGPRLDELLCKASRSFNTAEQTAHHMSLEIAETLQGQGIGRRLVFSATELYSALGIREVRLIAADIGRYVWAMCGFRPDGNQYQFLADAITDVARTLGYELEGFETTDGLWQLYYDIDEYITRDELADRLGEGHAGGGYLGSPEEPIRLGKALLLVNRVDTWTGTLTLGQNPGYDQLLLYNGE